MSRAIAADWFAVVGTTLLTFGTGAQALDNLAEFQSALNDVRKAGGLTVEGMARG